MAGSGRQTFKKRQKEQQRKERQQEKFAKRLQKKHEPLSSDNLGEPLDEPAYNEDSDTEQTPAISESERV
jgi:hypothetical protein